MSESYVFDSNSFKPAEEVKKFKLGEKEYFAREFDLNEITILGKMANLNQNDTIAYIDMALELSLEIVNARSVDGQAIDLLTLKKALPSLTSLTDFLLFLATLAPKQNPTKVLNNPAGLSRSQRRRLAKKNKRLQRLQSDAVAKVETN